METKNWSFLYKILLLIIQVILSTVEQTCAEIKTKSSGTLLSTQRKTNCDISKTYRSKLGPYYLRTRTQPNRNIFHKEYRLGARKGLSRNQKNRRSTATSHNIRRVPAITFEWAHGRSLSKAAPYLFSMSPDFRRRGRSYGGNNQNPKKSLDHKLTPPKIPCLISEP